ncbi:MAG: TolC family protein [Paramuribaculum sp.]|nr:TolC family protein [Paramuribaculum sp.]
MTIRTAASALLIMLTAAPANAIDFNSTAKTLAAESMAMKSARLSNRAVIEEMKGANSLPPLEAEAGYLWGEGETINKWNVSVSQSMDWPGAYAARRKGIEATGRALAAAERSTLIAKALEIKQAMIDIVVAKRNAELSNALNDTISQMIEVVRKGVDNGDITRLDLNKLEIERIAIAKQFAADKRSIITAVSALEALCGKNIDDIAAQLTDFPEEALLPENKYEELLTEANPSIFEAKENAISAKALAKAESRALLPGFSIGYTYENEVVDKWHGVTAGISIPLFTSRGAARAAKLRAEAAETDAILAAMQEVADLKSERGQALSLFKEIEEYKHVFEKEDNLKLLKKAFAAGQMTLLEYLGELNYFADAKREFIGVQYQYHLVMARLNRLTLLD